MNAIDHLRSMDWRLWRREFAVACIAVGALYAVWLFIYAAEVLG